MKPPSYYEMRGPILEKDDEQQSRTKTTKSQKKKRNRCKNHLFE